MKNNFVVKKASLTLAGVVLGGLLCGPCYAEETPVNLDWLTVVAYAAHQTEYTGVFVYQYDNRVETSRITHLVGHSGSEYEKLESLDGPKREIIRHHGQVWAWVNNDMVQVDSQQAKLGFPALLTEQLSALSANYQIIDAGKERVAGYNAQVIVFQPKDNLRYTQKIWVHSDLGLLLKSSVLNDKNRVVEQYAFTQLQIGGNLDRSWLKNFAAAVGPNHGKKTPSTSDVADVNKPAPSNWVIDDLPSGFKKTNELQRAMRGRPTTQMVFSDGLSAISVFIEPAYDSDDKESKGLSNRGAVNLYRKSTGKYLITAVGEVPARVVMKVVESIRYNGK